jgi:antitoxin CptB
MIQSSMMDVETVARHRSASLVIAHQFFPLMEKQARMDNFVSCSSQGEQRVIRCRRLLFRCWHRGTQESDVILGSFAETFLESLDSSQLSRFEALLDCTDPDLFDWIFGVSNPPPEHDHDVMQLLRSFCIERRHAPRQIGRHRI